MLAIMKKELKNYFFSPIGYIVIGIFLLIFSLFFFLTTIVSSSIELTSLFYYTALYGLMFITPLITMWTISGERKSGTDQLIMTSPVSMFGVVMGKFLSANILIFIPILFTLMYFGILSFFQMPNVPTYLTSVLGFALLSMAYVSFGVFVSSLTESPLISSILTFGAVFSSTLLPELIYGITGNNSLQSISLLNLYVDFLYGKIDIAHTVIYVTFTILCLAMTMVVMQRRKSVK